MRLSFSAIMPMAAACALFVTGCAAIEGIFKAGVWAGIVVVAFVGALAAAMLAMLRR